MHRVGAGSCQRRLDPCRVEVLDQIRLRSCRELRCELKRLGEHSLGGCHELRHDPPDPTRIIFAPVPWIPDSRRGLSLGLAVSPEPATWHRPGHTVRATGVLSRRLSQNLVHVSIMTPMRETDSSGLRCGACLWSWHECLRLAIPQIWVARDGLHGVDQEPARIVRGPSSMRSTKAEWHGASRTHC
jgi:hypothetical protein